MRGVWRCAVLSAVLALAGGPDAAAQSTGSAPAEQPQTGRLQISNARVETVAVTGGLAATLGPLIDRATTPLWAAWVVPAEGGFTSCCWEGSGWEGCRLEPVPAGTTATPMARTGPVLLEGDRELVMLVRIEAQRIDRLRTVGLSCPLDAGGLPFVTLTGVTASQSVAWLRPLVDVREGEGKRRVADAALHAISRHADPAVVPMLLALARDHAEPKVRGSALVVLAQTAGRRVAPDLSGAVDNDPDTEVKKRAVFAISQLPKDESVPRLIALAREHKNPAVRRQAMFWLGQSKDPRAIDFFAAILKS
jgi:hypothetical protein